MQSDNPLFDQVNPEMASRRGNGGEPVSPAAVAASSTSSSTAHASAAAADPPPPAVVVTDAMRKEARNSARNAFKRKWNKWSEEDKVEATDGFLEVIVEREAAKAGESAERREKEAAKADLAARDAAAPLWNHVVENPGTVFPVAGETKPQTKSYYASPDLVAGAPFYEMFRSDAALELLSKAQVNPSEWIAIEALLYNKPVRGELRVMSSEADVATEVGRLGKACCSEVVNLALAKKRDHVFFHQEHTLSETSSRGAKAARTTRGLRPDVVGGHFLRESLQFRFVGEDKHIMVYRLEDEPKNLAALYNSKDLSKAQLAAVRYPVDQLYTYMIVMLLKYGFLTTYNTWWFCKREWVKVTKNGKKFLSERLLISEPITAESTRPTLAEAVSLFVLAAVLDSKSVGMEAPSHVVAHVQIRYEEFPNNAALNADIKAITKRFGEAVHREHTRGNNISSQQQQQGSSSTKRDTDMPSPPNDASAEPSLQDIPSLPLAELSCEPELGRELGRGRTGTTFEAKIDEFPLPVAFKIADIVKMDAAEEELKHEHGAYMRMVNLWGTVVPFLAWGGRMPWGRAGLATSLAGARTLEQHLKQRKPIDMPALERTLRDGLAQIHACGLAHGDVEMRNIVVDDGEEGLEAKFIDFGSSSVLDDDGHNTVDVSREQERDFVYLRNMLTTAKSWAVEQTQEGCDAPRSAKSCYLFATRHGCKHGSNCRFFHDRGDVNEFEKQNQIQRHPTPNNNTNTRGAIAQPLIAASSAPIQILGPKDDAKKQVTNGDHVIR